MFNVTVKEMKILKTFDRECRKKWTQKFGIDSHLKETVSFSREEQIERYIDQLLFWKEYDNDNLDKLKLYFVTYSTQMVINRMKEQLDTEAIETVLQNVGLIIGLNNDQGIITDNIQYPICSHIGADTNCKECSINYYFRGGSQKHCFEYGQKNIFDWRNKSEIDVLILRVKTRKKHFASYVIQYDDNKNDIIRKLKKFKLSYHDFKNSYRVDVINFTNEADKKLIDIVNFEEISKGILTDVSDIKNKLVGDYLKEEIDLTNNSLTALEVGILLTYPLQETINLFLYKG